MRRLATFVLLLGPVVLIGLLPTRPLVSEVWPQPVEEWVLDDGHWILQPAPRSLNQEQTDQLRVRTRPLSVLAAQLDDGSRVHGYLLERVEDGDTLVLQTGPETIEALPVARLTWLYHPNDMSFSERLRLAFARLRALQPLS